jgi:hypothetical protein
MTTKTVLLPNQSLFYGKSWRDVLPIHPAAELFPLMSPAELRKLGEDIKKNGLTSPIVLWSDRKSPAVLLDGRNRLDAIEMATGSPAIIGAPSIMAGKDFLARDRVITLDQSADPLAYVISANIHRRHLTAEQKRDLIAKLIKATPKKSDRQIATATKTDHKTVASVRAEQEARGEIPHVSTRIDSKGRKQPAKKPKTKAERNRKALERRMAERAAKRRREAERADIKEAETKTEAERLAAGLIRTDRGLARALHEFLVQCGADAIDLMDALSHLLGSKGNDADAEASADKRREQFAAIEAKGDPGPIPEFLRRS